MIFNKNKILLGILSTLVVFLLSCGPEASGKRSYYYDADATQDGEWEWQDLDGENNEELPPIPPNDDEEGNIPGPKPPQPDDDTNPPDDDPEPTPPSDLNHSKGSGGKTGNYESSFTSSGTYNTKSSYKMRIPSNVHDLGAQGLVVYLHGDNAGDYRSDWIFQPVADWAKDRDIIALSVLSPDGGKQWYSSPDKHAYFLHQLLQNKIFKEYNIDKNRIYFTGSSGGSQFLTGGFIPLYGNNYGGGAFPTCGGANVYNWLKPSFTEEFKNKFQIFYYTQTRDFLYPQVVKSAATYRGLGVTVNNEYPTHCSSSRCHCDFKVVDVMKKAMVYFEGY